MSSQKASLWDQSFDAANFTLIKYIDPVTSQQEQVRLFEKLAPHWRDVACHIGLSFAVISTIESSGSGKTPDMCLMVVLGKWEDANTRYPATWCGVCGLLNDYGHATLAKKLQAAIKAETSTLHGNYEVSEIDDHNASKTAPVISTTEDLVKFLTFSDLNSLSTRAAEVGVISAEVKNSFDSLDSDAPCPRKIRYLLLHASEQLEANPKLLERWIKVLADELEKGFNEHGMYPDFSQLKKELSSVLAHNYSQLEPDIEVVSQPLDTTVAEKKSTLLEVQAISTHGDTISYQWVKDGKPLQDDGEHYLGSKKSILCLTNACLATQGTYTCEMKCTHELHGAPTVSKPVVVRVAVQHFTQVLVDMYRAWPNVPKDAWPPRGAVTYLNLALVKQEVLDRKDDFSCYTLQGDVDDIVYKKESVEYDRVFSTFRSGAFVLIEGRPGSGKTTLVHKVSKDWAQGEPVLKGAKLVFYIALRVLSTIANLTMEDIVKLFYHDDHDAMNVLKHINSTNGEGVCFILDGLDEYSNTKTESVINKILEKEIFLNSMVIVSSRPNATIGFRSRADFYIEVIGFLKDQIREYINTYPFTRGRAEDLLSYLDQHPNIMHMCYLPVHVVVVSFLHNIMETLPCTECGIYTHFTQFTLVRKEGHLAKDCSLDKLSGDMKKVFLRICRLAFEMTINHRQIFEDKELFLSKACTGIADPSLGLVTIDSTIKLYGYHNLYTFVHLTFQEYLAAYHISSLENQHQLEVIKEYGEMKHMRIVLKFYCGLVNFDENNLHIFGTILDMDKSTHLFHCQCAFESQQTATCSSVVLHSESSLSHFYNLHLNDFTCIRYVISNSSSPLESLDLSDCSQISHLEACGDVLKVCNDLQSFNLSANILGYEAMKALSIGLENCSDLKELILHHTNIQEKGAAEVLAKCLKNLGHLRHINLASNKLGDENFNILCEGLKECHDLSHLFLAHNHIGIVGVKGLCEVLEQCSKISHLSLIENPIGDEGAACLCKGLRQCSSLFELILYKCQIADEGAKSIGKCLVHLSNLFTLSLSANKIGDEGTKGLSEGLSHCSNLSDLVMHNNLICDEGAKCLLDGLRQCSKLSYLTLSSNLISDESVKYLAESLGHWSIKILNLSGNLIGGEGARCLGRGLLHCSDLSVLNLNNNYIGDEGARGLSEGLRNCHNLSELHLDSNRIGGVSIRGLSEGLRNCSNLFILHLNSNHIGDEGARGLSEGLRNCHNLFELHLDSNHIGDEGARSLSEGLRNCHNLFELHLDSNHIGDEGARSLSEGLRNCVTLFSIYLLHNPIGNKGIGYLAEGMFGSYDTLKFIRQQRV